MLKSEPCETRACGEYKANMGAGDRVGQFPKIRLPCYIDRMNSQDALERLRRSEHALRARGVRRAALFGSVARGENRPDSDIDIFVEIDPDAHITVFDY